MPLELTAAQRERFWSLIVCDLASGCWLWRGSRNRQGYGRISFGPAGGNRTYLAHRVAWELERGPIPDGWLLCHNCPQGDTRLCVRPAHAFLGTPADNIRDMMRKGRHWRQGGRPPEQIPDGFPWHRPGRIPATCERCGAAFVARRDRIETGRGRFCSRTCANRTNHPTLYPPVALTCEVCGSAFTRDRSYLWHGSGRFCSQVCMGKHYSQNADVVLDHARRAIRGF